MRKAAWKRWRDAGYAPKEGDRVHVVRTDTLEYVTRGTYGFDEEGAPIVKNKFGRVVTIDGSFPLFLYPEGRPDSS